MPEIIVYSSQTCPYCRAAEQLLERKGIKDYQKILIDRDPEQRTIMMQRTQQRTVPQIFIGDFHVGGYTELAALEHEGKLDGLLKK